MWDKANGALLTFPRAPELSLYTSGAQRVLCSKRMTIKPITVVTEATNILLSTYLGLEIETLRLFHVVSQ